MGLLLRGLGGAVRAVEVRLDDLEHADDATGLLLLALVGAREARTRGVLVHRRGLDEHRRLLGLLVENLEDVEGLGHSLDSLLRLLDGVQVVLLLLRPVLRRSRESVAQVRGLGGQQVNLLVEFFQLDLQCLDLLIQLLAVCKAEVAVLVGLADLGVTEALLRRLASGLAEQALDQLLNQGLNLDEGVVKQMHRERSQGGALEAPAFLAEQGDDLVLARLGGECGRVRAAELAPADVVLGGNNLLNEGERLHVPGNADQVGLLLLNLRRQAGVLLLEERTLVHGGVQTGYLVLQDLQRSRQGCQLVAAQLRALVPVLGPGLALLREVLQIRLVVLEDGLGVDQVLPRLRDVALERLDVAIEGLHGLSVLVHLRPQGRDGVLEGLLGDGPLLVQVLLLGLEILIQLREGLDNALGVVLVRGVGRINAGLQEGAHGTALRRSDEAQHIGQGQAGLHRGAEGEQRRRLRGLHGLDRAV
mmetsp:Transcript_46780/g.125075  ORF Transcript_46780/g.125075 Transcript_46780/m.125075 type:complete len:475 (-) Transcript_46780:473-1897(-)